MKRLLKSIAFALMGRESARRLHARLVARPHPFRGEIQAILSDPLNPQLHLNLAKCHLGKGGDPYTAFAELKAAQFLGQAGMPEWTSQLTRPRLEHLPHNQHFRFQTLAAEIVRVAEGRSVSVLDVGGGPGQLARFLPDDYQYCLAEPMTNGISGEHLPFADRSFDIVVACHVLEHIPQNARTAFLDSLARRARHAVILLNPFQIPGAPLEAPLQLIVEITNAQWAKEHVACVVPTRQSIEDYARSRDYEFQIEFNGTSPLTLALVFVDYFAAQANQIRDWKAIQEYYNGLAPDSLHSATDPTALLVTMWINQRS